MILLLAVPLVVPLASAWDAVGVWPDEALPLVIEASDGADAPPGWAAGLEAAATTWNDVTCSRAGLQLDWVDATTFDSTDRVNSVLYGDTSGWVPPGYPSESYSKNGGDTFYVGDLRLQELIDVDTVFGLSSLYVTPTQVASGDCDSQWDVQAVATRALGFVLGLAPVCPEGADCSAEELAASMAMPLPCDSAASTLSDDDIAGVRALYGPAIGVDCGAAVGPAPLVVSCTTTSRDVGEATLTWDLGDGASDSGAAVEHTYTAEGAYTVEVCADVATDTCTGYRPCTHADVLVCAVPAPSLAIAWTEGLGVEIVDTNVTAHGCGDVVHWTVTDASGTVLAESERTGRVAGPEPFLTFVPAAGDYRATLQLSGPGGEGQASLDFTVDPAHGSGDGSEVGGGCSTAPLTPPRSPVWLATALAMWGARRRRR